MKPTHEQFAPFDRHGDPFFRSPCSGRARLIRVPR
jgi:hypothetical protein